MNQEEKKEQLKLTKSRLNVLRKRTGKNIIDSFQKTFLKKEEENLNHMSEEEQIEEILEEANAYNLREEVKTTAEKIFKKNDMFSRIDAYVTAYNEWIK